MTRRTHHLTFAVRVWVVAAALWVEWADVRGAEWASPEEQVAWWGGLYDAFPPPPSKAWRASVSDRRQSPAFIPACTSAWRDRDGLRYPMPSPLSHLGEGRHIR